MKVVNAYCPVERPFDISTVPVVRGNAIRFLWADDFWDGPRSGVCEFENDRYWFQNYYDPWYANDEALDRSNIDERLLALVDHSPPLQSFLIHQLTREQMDEEAKWQELFIKSVGGHHDYREGMNSEAKPKAEMNRFYQPYNRMSPTLDLAQATVVAIWLR